MAHPFLLEIHMICIARTSISVTPRCYHNLSIKMDSTAIIAIIVLSVLLTVAAGAVYYLYNFGSRTESPPPPPPPTPPGPPQPGDNVVYSGDDFLKLFSSYPSQSDPTGGISNYASGQQLTKTQTQPDGTVRVLIGTAGSTPFSGVPLPQTGSIPSVRLYTQNQVFNGGLFSIEIFHMPADKSAWPAIWFSQDSNQTLPSGQKGQWPINGEIDWIEQVFDSDTNQSTLHIDGWTSCGVVQYSCETGTPVEGCSDQKCLCPATETDRQTGQQIHCPHPCSSNMEGDCPYACAPKISGGALIGPSNCSVHGGNVGCGIKGPSGSFGSAFNSAHGSTGAVFSMQWKHGPGKDGNYVAFYFITDRALIDNKESGPFSSKPDLSLWPAPYGVFDATSTENRCILTDVQLIINIAVCGSWPEQNFRPPNTCAVVARQGLQQSYFEIGRLAILKQS